MSLLLPAFSIEPRPLSLACYLILDCLLFGHAHHLPRQEVGLLLGRHLSVHVCIELEDLTVTQLAEVLVYHHGVEVILLSAEEDETYAEDAKQT